MNQSELLIGDAERHRSIVLLRDACGDGRLSLDEFTDRVNAVYAARTHQQLGDLIRDLAVHQPTHRAAPVRWTVTILSDNKQKGRWRLDGETNTVTILGSTTLDLRHASFGSDEVIVNAQVILGSVKIIVPEGTEVELGGLVILGSKDSKMNADNVRPDAPIVRIRGVIVLGSLDVVTR